MVRRLDPHLCSRRTCRLDLVYLVVRVVTLRTGLHRAVELLLKRVWSTASSVGAWRLGGDAAALTAAFIPNADINVVSPPEIVAPKVTLMAITDAPSPQADTDARETHCPRPWCRACRYLVFVLVRSMAEYASPGFRELGSETADLHARRPGNRFPL
jgi:hypothetical protein